MTDTKPQIQDTQRNPRWINIKKFTARSIGFKLQKIKDKEKTLKRSQVWEMRLGIPYL